MSNYSSRSLYISQFDPSKSGELVDMDTIMVCAPISGNFQLIMQIDNDQFLS